MTMKIKKKILLIEDEEGIILPLKIKLEKRGFELIIARDGEAGLAALRSEKPDLVLLDIILPKMNGFEILEQIKKEDGAAKIPIVVISNLAREGEIERGLGLGARDFIVKANLSLDNLVDKISKFLI